jgi:DNA-directed RNA polymerase subunit M/transcription elongation factor TFIIS
MFESLPEDVQAAIGRAAKSKLIEQMACYCGDDEAAFKSKVSNIITSRIMLLAEEPAVAEHISTGAIKPESIVTALEPDIIPEKWTEEMKWKSMVNLDSEQVAAHNQFLVCKKCGGFCSITIVQTASCDEGGKIIVRCQKCGRR